MYISMSSQDQIDQICTPGVGLGLACMEAHAEEYNQKEIIVICM